MHGVVTFETQNYKLSSSPVLTAQILGGASLPPAPPQTETATLPVLHRGVRGQWSSFGTKKAHGSGALVVSVYTKTHKETILNTKCR